MQLVTKKVKPTPTFDVSTAKPKKTLHTSNSQGWAKSQPTQTAKPQASSGTTPSSTRADNANSPPSGPRAAAKTGATAKDDTQAPKTEGAKPKAAAAKQPGGPKSKEAEDLPAHKKPPPPFNQKDRKQKKGRTSFTDESCDGSDWVRTVDPNTGRPYWYHWKTMETRWDKPTAPTTSTPKAETKQEPSSPKPPPDPQRPKTSAGTTPDQPDSGNASPNIAPDVKNLEEAEEVARVKADVLSQLDKTVKEDVASRKKTFKFLCLRWHPDKNTDDKELATAVFQFLQAQRDWYLKDA